MIWAGTNGYLDALPLAKVRAFEDGLLSLLRGKNVDILNTIRDSRDLSDDTAAKLKSGGRGFRQDVCLEYHRHARRCRERSDGPSRVARG